MHKSYRHPDIFTALNTMRASSTALASSTDEPCDCNATDRSSLDRDVICVFARSSSQDRPTSTWGRKGDSSLPAPRSEKFVALLRHQAPEYWSQTSQHRSKMSILPYRRRRRQHTTLHIDPLRRQDQINACRFLSPSSY